MTQVVATTILVHECVMSIQFALKSFVFATCVVVSAGCISQERASTPNPPDAKKTSCKIDNCGPKPATTHCKDESILEPTCKRVKDACQWVQGTCPGACGGIANVPCSEQQFCKYPEGSCDQQDIQGTCTQKPKKCTKEHRPVCGCDGKTYPNPCQAEQAQMIISHQGSCKPKDKSCGGIAGLTCEKDEFCNYPIGTKCGVADQMGVCSKRPEVCTMQVDPVCGCDNKTHSNSCAAASAGISVVHKGACKN